MNERGPGLDERKRGLLDYTHAEENVEFESFASLISLGRYLHRSGRRCRPRFERHP